MKTTKTKTTNRKQAEVKTPKAPAELTKTEQAFVDTFDGIFKGALSIRSQLKKWLKDEKQYVRVTNIAEYYKRTDEAKAKSLKAQIQQVAKENDINLSLQGLGQKQTAVLKEPKSAKGGNKKTKDKDNTKTKKKLTVDDYVKVATVFNTDDYAEAVFKLAEKLTNEQKEALINTLM